MKIFHRGFLLTAILVFPSSGGLEGLKFGLFAVLMILLWEAWKIMDPSN